MTPVQLRVLFVLSGEQFLNEKSVIMLPRNKKITYIQKIFFAKHLLVMFQRPEELFVMNAEMEYCVLQILGHMRTAFHTLSIKFFGL